MLRVHCLELKKPAKCGLYILPALLFAQFCDEIRINIYAHSPQYHESADFL
jgi:hypothetical protein